jgi:hypothetical protein
MHEFLLLLHNNGGCSYNKRIHAITAEVVVHTVHML